MVSHFVKFVTNINKMNNHLSSLNTKKTMTYGIRNLGSDLGQVQKYVEVKPFNVIPTLPL